MLEIDESTIFKLNSNYSLSALGSEKSKHWLFELNEGNIYRLNEVSFYMLSLLDGRNTFAGIVKAVSNRYDGASKDEIIQDSNKFFIQCLENGIIYKMEVD